MHNDKTFWFVLWVLFTSASAIALAILVNTSDTTELRQLRHSICELLEENGADSTTAADVEACTFPATTIEGQ